MGHFFKTTTTAVLLILACGRQAHAVEPICPGGASPRSDIILCEDWDSYTGTPAAFPNTHNATWNGWTVDRGGSSEGTSSLDTSVKFSGGYSLHQSKLSNQNSVPLLRKTFASTQQIRVRAYVYFGSSYANFGQNDYNVHFIFHQSALSGNGVRVDLRGEGVNCTTGGAFCDTWPPTCYEPSPPPQKAFFVVASPGNSTGNDVYLGVDTGQTAKCWDAKTHLSGWHFLEYAFQITNATTGQAAMWIDGNPVMAPRSLPPDDSYLDFSDIMLSGFQSGLAAPEALDFFLDNIVVSNCFGCAIGAAGAVADTLSPASPQNLLAQ